MSLEATVKKIIADRLDVSEDQVVESASFIEDLGADSLDQVELLMAFEDEFEKEIPDGDSEKLTTVGAVITYLKEQGIDG